jgi:NAD(P)-dependent dehydrogenase (short-subunit alcohol dehydrogenase family)
VVSTEPLFAGQVAVVTGAAGAIGSALASELANQGARVACLDVASPAEVAEHLSRQGGSGLALEVDLTEEAAVEEAFRQVVAWAGRVDVLVNMAGLYYGVPRVPFWEIDAATWAAVVDSNLRTAFFSCKAVSEHMRAAGAGRIVNVSSKWRLYGLATYFN